MGRNKPRSKAVDVTKSLLQPTSVTDHIAVQISTNAVIQVSEEDLNPTQGSEAAFALRREGKLDTTMKLCLNWRQGNCHNHAACSFAHVVRYFGVIGDLPSPVTTGRTGAFGPNSGSGACSNAVAANSTGRSGSGRTAGGVNSNASWSQKLAPPSYSAEPNRAATTRAEERKAPPPPLPASTMTTMTTTGGETTMSAAEAKTATPPPLQSAASTATTEGTPNSVPATRPALGAAAPAEPSETARENSGAIPLRLANATPAVLSPEGLRNILASLATSIAATVLKPTAIEAGEEAAEGNKEKALHPREFLAAREAAGADTPAAPWQKYPTSTKEEIIVALGKQILGEAFEASKPASVFYEELRVQQLRRAMDMERQMRTQVPDDAAQSPGGEFGVQTAPAVATDRLFSTAPTAAPVVASGIGQLGATGIPLGSAHADGIDDGDLSVPGLSYQHLMNMFAPEE